MLINLTGRPGMVGRLMMGARLLRCDPETGEPQRNVQGFCESATEGEVGLYVAPNNKISPFDGYADKEATRKKILVDVFKKGDSWFNSGDLMTLHDDHWVAFADRVGDTFRWKAENVSTMEVAEILNGAPGVLETNVYGVEVPGADGRAGMASVHVGEGFSVEKFGRFAAENLASYQRPVFVRLQTEMELTVTLKHQKVGYRRDGYDPSKVGDPLYLLEDDGYTKLDDEVYAQLKDGRRVIR
jgi:fatty-acyl-CoA synthase